MRIINKSLTVVLSMLMLSMAIVMAMPVAGSTSQASQSYISLNWSGISGKVERTLDEDKAIVINYTMTVEVGQTFNIGDFAVGSFEGRLSDSDNIVKSATFKSSKKSIATVSKSGVVKPKKKGKTELSIKLDDETIKLTLKVVGQKYSQRDDVIAIQDEITSLLKKYPKESSITVKNGVTVAKRIANIDKKIAAFKVSNNKINKYGFYRSDYYYYRDRDFANRLVIVNYAQYSDLVETFYDLQAENNPYDLTKAGFSISSASGNFNSETVSVKFAKKVSATQVFALISLSDYNQNFKSTMSVDVDALILKSDAAGNLSYYDTAYSKVKKGTKSIKLHLADELLDKGTYIVYLTYYSTSMFANDNYNNDSLIKNITPSATFTIQ